MNNNSTNTNLGQINDNFYVNNTNKINNFELMEDKRYLLLIENKLLDIKNNKTIDNYIIYRDNNYNEKYYKRKMEITPSLPAMVNILNDNSIDIKYIINLSKPWDDWTFYL